MASVKRVEYKSGRVVYRIVICQGYDKKGNKLVKNLTYSVNQSATPKQQEREAKKYAMDMEDKLKYGYDYNAEKMSFEDFAYKWLESVKDNIAYGTYAGYKQVLESRIIPYFKGDKIAHIKTPHIEAFYRTLVDDYSAGTIKRFANVLNLIFKTAKRYSMIENNPCQDAQKPKRKDEDEGLKFFTPKQALMFMKSLDMSYEVTYKGHQRIDDTGKPYYVNEYTESYTVPTQYKVFFTLSLFCGFRKGETLALHWNDIDFKEKKISISKSVGMTENGFDYKEPKTKKSVRKVSIPDDVIPLLKQYHFEYIQTRFSHGTAWQGDLSNGGNLFIQADGKLMGHTTPYQYFTKHLHRYNEWVQNNPDKAKAEGLEELPIIPLHGLRHPYVKHTTKIFSLRLMDFQAQAYPDARRKTRGACQLLRVGQSRSPVRPLCNRKRFSCLPPQSKMSWILYAISMRLSGYTSTRSISSSASSVVSVSASKIALDASLRLSCRACSSCFCFACANTAA